MWMAVGDCSNYWFCQAVESNHAPHWQYCESLSDHLQAISPRAQYREDSKDFATCCRRESYLKLLTSRPCQAERSWHKPKIWSLSNLVNLQSRASTWWSRPSSWSLPASLLARQGSSAKQQRLWDRRSQLGGSRHCPAGLWQLKAWSQWPEPASHPCRQQLRYSNVSTPLEWPLLAGEIASWITQIHATSPGIERQISWLQVDLLRHPIRCELRLLSGICRGRGGGGGGS